MSDRGMDRLAAELRRWAERPGDLSPAAARTRVLTELPLRRRRPAWRLAAAGAAMAGAALAVALTVGRQSEPVGGPPPAAEIGYQTIVHELSSGTKLYIVMRHRSEQNEG